MLTFEMVLVLGWKICGIRSLAGHRPGHEWEPEESFLRQSCSTLTAQGL
jgi:hypothetical protein